MSVIPRTFDKEAPRFKKNPRDLFITPYKLAFETCQILIRKYIFAPRSILDPGCGTGIWGKAARETWMSPNIVGVDLVNQVDNVTPSGFKAYNEILVNDYLKFDPGYPYELILGNPPFSSKENRRLASDFVQHSLFLLDEKRGVLALFLKTEFLSAEYRMDELFAINPPIAMIQYVPRPQFDGYRFNNTIEYAMFVFKKQNPKKLTEVHWLNWKTGAYF